MRTSVVPNGCRVLLVDDDRALSFGLAGMLRRSGYDVIEASSCESALAATDPEPEAILVDLRLPDGDGIELLPRLRARAPAASLVVMTGHGSIDLAVRAMKAGAEDFIPKPFEVPTLLGLMSGIVDRRRSAGRPSHERATGPFEPRSDAARRLDDEVERLRNADCSILILGETGTGKSFLARRIHAIGERGAGPFVDLNCAGLGRELAESELFGHERGAFTGAQRTKVGLFEAAHAGTLFLDEIGDIDLQVQPKVLKVIEEKRFRRLGEVRERVADVRLLAATHRDLVGAIGAGQFRADLFYRLSTVTLTVPPLRERRADIVPLARHLLHAVGDGAIDLTSSAEAALTSYGWPGNIRELRNVLERAVLLRRADVLDERDLRLGEAPRAAAGPDPDPAAAADSLRDLEREHIRRALDLEGGRVEAAARRLGVPRSTLYQKIKVYGLSRPRGALRSGADRRRPGAA